MNFLPSRSGAFPFLAAAGIGLLSATATAQTPAPFAPPTDLQPQAAPAAPPAGTPPALDPEMKAELAHTDSGNRHVAPHGTFFLLSYVSVRTDTGVVGFEPGQEVHLVEVHPATHTLVVTDGTTQVEVPPSKLTHDLDIAAMVRQKDAANQTRIAEYQRQQQEAYDRFERDAAAAGEKRAEQREEKEQQEVAQVKEVQEEKREHPNALSTPSPAPNADIGNPYGAGYYNDGGYGYGSPFAYFVNTAPAASTNNAPAAAPAKAAPNNVAAPAAHAAAPGRPK